MSLFQKSVLNKYLQTLDNTEVEKAFQKFKSFYSDEERIENIKLLKEENYQEGFLREIFVAVLGYTINPDKDYNLTTEFKNETDSKKADGAILLDGKAIGVIELKSTKTTDMDSIIDQAFNYKNHQTGCKYVITSNFEKLRFYIDNATEYEEFYLFDMDLERFKIFYLLLSKEKLLNGIPAKIKKESQLHEEDISDKLYKDYSEFKYKIYRNLIKNNPGYDKLVLFKKSQKLLDRILFILFAEDSGLVPPNAISEIIKQWKTLIELDEKKSLYSRFVKFFHHLNVGHKYSKFEVPAYNGGLFKEDEVLDKVKIDDEILLDDALKLSTYDYSTEVDVNILGHIFEHSISEIEEITAELEGEERDASKSKRKKEGVFYTPKYITKYIVENTIGELCDAKKKELQLDEIDEEILENSKTAKGKLTKKAETLFKNLETYREYILSLKILDPACGSGAFLNQALDFLIEEHKWIDEQRSRLLKESFTIVEYEKDILEHNLYGVDINEEAVEIAKLSLWLRTAKKGRKLSDLSGNIKCGNSLIDDPEVAGDKAFKWEEEFPEIMNSGGFDVVIGNPPYLGRSSNFNSNEKSYIRRMYKSYEGKFELYQLFIEKSFSLTRKNLSYISLITPQTWLSIIQATKLRSLAFGQSQLREIVFLGKDVFNDASVDTIIFVLSIGSKNSVIKYLESNNLLIRRTAADEIKYEVIRENNFILPLSGNKDELLFMKKISKESIILSEIGIWSDGIKIVGNAKDFAFQKNKFNDSFFPMLLGKDIERYFYSWGGYYCCRDKKQIELHNASDIRLRDEQMFLRKKILIRKTGNSIVAAVDFENFYYEQSLFSFGVYNEQLYKLEYIISILNSSIAHFLLKSNTFSKKDTFPQIRLHWLKTFPIKDISLDDQKPFINKTDEMLSMNNQLQEIMNRFIHRIKDYFGLEKISKKLQSFYEYDFKQFRAELKKQKITLSLKQQDEWEEYFNEHKEKIQELQSQINQTDREIDQLVYELYGLTEEEIKIVEGDRLKL